MSKKQLDYVRQLIQQKRYDEARVILQSLAMEDETAQQWLAKLNTIAPQQRTQSIQVEVNQNKGCLTQILTAIAAVFLTGYTMLLVVVGCLIIACIGAVILVAAAITRQQEISQTDAIAANAGHGDIENPIPAGNPVIFTDFNVTPLQIIRPATNNSLLEFNEPPAAGTDYVLVRFKVDCKKAGSTVCRGYAFKSRLVDANGAEWGEPTLAILEENLDTKEAIGGSSMEGWQVFEFPRNETLNLFKLWVEGGSTLYTRPPG